MKEKPLSEKREELFKAYGHRIPSSFKVIILLQDKEAVKRLKEEVRARDVPVSGIMEEIEKIFGDLK